MSMEKPLDPEKLRNVLALVLDVDGVLTNGQIVYDGQGEEIKSFSVHDGLGIRMLQDAGIPVGIVTGRACPALTARLANLGIQHKWVGVTDKAGVLPQVEAALGIPGSRMAYMGDDFPDLGLFSRVGVSITVAGAHPLVRDAAQIITTKSGGHGAVREVCEAILASQGRMHEILQKFRA